MRQSLRPHICAIRETTTPSLPATIPTYSACTIAKLKRLKEATTQVLYDFTKHNWIQRFTPWPRPRIEQISCFIFEPPPEANLNHDVVAERMWRYILFDILFIRELCFDELLIMTRPGFRPRVNSHHGKRLLMRKFVFFSAKRPLKISLLSFCFCPSTQ